jgi:anti-sigma factor RsiW
MRCEVVEHDLDAYLDRELDADFSTAIREHVGRCAACGRQLAQREALARLVRGAPYYSAPVRLRARVLAQSTRSKSMRPVVMWAAAAVLALSVGAGISLFRPGSTRGDAIADDVVNSHVRSLMANHLFDVQSTDLHTVKPWFLGKLDFSPPVVNLAAVGFPLVGGRLDYIGGRPVAALVYQRQRHTINVFVSPERDDVRARRAALIVRGFNVHHWFHQGMSFWAVSDLNDVELTELITALQSP